MCPRCRRSPSADPEVSEGAKLPRCPEHGLAYVAERELPLTGSDPFLGKTLVDRFVILGRLGAGSMGAVYRAHQEAVGRDVALKIVRRDRAYEPETKLRFEREARAMSSLESPHTVTVFDFGEAGDGSWFLAMEMLVGETLGEHLRRHGPLPWQRAVRIAREALESLAEAHSKGIIHRDLKPDNLFLVRRPPGADAAVGEMCKVLDFGIAKLQHDDRRLDQLETQAGTVFGTPRYMSPEQAQGSELDARSDLYSLGVIMFQMLTGRAPFVDDDAVVVMAKHIKEPPPSCREVAPDREIPPQLERVVERVLAKTPEARIQSAEQFSADLDEALREARRSLRHAAQATSTAALAPVAGPSAPQRHSLGAGFLTGVVLTGVALSISFVGALRWWWGTAPQVANTPSESVRGVAASMPHAMNESATPKPLPVQSFAEPATPASAASVVARPQPSALAADPAGPPTRGRRQLQEAWRRPETTVTRETMEPRRPDERYGRFR